MKRLVLPLIPLVLAGACTNPHRSVEQTETALVRYTSCDDLEVDLKDMLLNEVEASFAQMRYWRNRGGPVNAAEDTAGAPPTSAPREEGKDYSGTNNQEKGVDESDFVKTDGYRIYVLNGNRLHIFGVPNFGDLVPTSVTQIEGWPRDMLVNRDAHRMSVFSMVPVTRLPDGHPLKARAGANDLRGTWYWRVPEVTKVTVLDVADPAQPKLVREIYLEGWYQMARMVGTSIRLGSYSWLNIPALGWYRWWGNESLEQREAATRAAIRALSLDDIVPRIYERLPDRTFTTYAITEQQCQSFHRPEDSQGRGITSILSFDLLTPRFRVDADFLVSNYATFYMSLTHLYIAEHAHDWWWFWWNHDRNDQTNIHSFDISQPGKTIYVGSGRVQGMINDSFSMDEHRGHLRVATTTDLWSRWWLDGDRPPLENHVWVLANDGAGRLRKVGHLDGLALGERLWAARFEGSRGYLVTAEYIDPLFTLDLSDPRNPRVAGQLKVPGVSTYIHELEGGQLLTVGWGGDATGIDWSAQVSLYNVADFANPALTDVERLGFPGGYSWSEALWEHKAFQYWAPRKLLAVPVSSYRSTSEGGSWRYDYVSQLRLVKVDPTGLSHYGDIDHSGYYNDERNVWWRYTDIRRSIFMGDFIYAISDRGVTVHRIADLGLVTAQKLPGWLPDQWWWWW